MPTSASAPSPHPNITVRRRRLPVENDPEEKENSKLQESSSSKTRDFILRQFREAAQQTCQASFWEDKATLAASVIQANLRQESKSTAASERFSKSEEAALFSSARKVIKEATEDKAKVLPCLCVGLYTLRALSCREPDRVEAVIKCLYHVITTAESAMDDARVAQYGFMAYEALGRLLVDYFCRARDDDKKIIAFKMPRECSHDVLQNLFPVPFTKKSTSATPLGSLPSEQLSTIGIRSTLAVARVVSRMTTHQTKSIDEEFRISRWSRMSKARLHESFAGVVHILQNVLPSWISLLALDKQVDEKGVQQHCKAAYQTLLQAATSSSDADQALKLRQHAIIALLGRDLDEKLQPGIVNKYLELACNSAHRHSALHVQDSKIACPVGSTHAIARFHEAVGDVLDEAASSSTSPSYRDYCATRALHVGVRNAKTICCTSRKCIFRKLGGGAYAHKNCEKDADATTMALFFTIFHVLDNFEAQTMTKTVETDYKPIIDQFLSIRDRCDYRELKLLTSASLHRRVHEYLSSYADSQADDVRRMRSAFKATASILGECMAPLATDVAESGKMDQAYDSMYWCFRGAIGLLETLASVSPDLDYQRQSDDLMRKIIGVHFLGRTRKDVSATVAENLAKYLSSIGRRRHEQEQKSESTVPLLFSLRLFHLLPAERLKSLQISSRWTFLATIYKAQGFLKEAFLASACALLYAQDEYASSAPPGSDHAIHACRHMAAVAGWIQIEDHATIGVLSAQHVAVASRLVASFIDLTRLSDDWGVDSMKDSSYMSAESIIDTLLNVALEDAVSISSCPGRPAGPLSLVAVLKEIIARSPDSKKDLQGSFAIFHVLLETLICLGRAIQGHGSQTVFAVGLEQYTDMSRLCVSFLQKLLKHERVASIVMISMLQATVATIAQSCRKRWVYEARDDRMDERSSKLMSSSSGTLSTAIASAKAVAADADDWSVLGCSIIPSILFMQLHIQPSSAARAEHAFTVENLVSNIREVAQILADDSPWSPVVGLAKDIASVSLSRASDYLKAQGERLHAYEVACLGQQFTSRHNSLLSLWFEATAFLLEGDESILTCEEDTENVSVLSCIRNDASDPRLFAIISRLQHAARFVDSDSFGEDLLSLWKQIKCWLEKSSDEFISTFLYWYRCIVEFALADIVGRQGDIMKELHFAKLSFRSCQAAASQLTYCHKRRPNMTGDCVLHRWMANVSETMAISLRQKEIECREQIATAFLKCGNWKKALQYSFSAIRLGCYGWIGDLDNIATFPRLLNSSRANPCQSSRDMQLRRTLFGIMARATAADVVHDELVDCVAFVGPPDVDSLGGVGLNWELDSLLCELDVLRILGEDLSNPDLADDLSGISSHLENTYGSFLIKPATRALARSLNLKVELKESLAPVVPLALKLQQANHHLATGGSREGAIRLCRDIVEQVGAPSIVKAEAFYLLGLIDLTEARLTGELASLWHGHSNLDSDDISSPDQSAIISACAHFNAALRTLGSASDSLARKILRCLALVSGPGETACAMIHTSIGRDLRLHVLTSLSDRDMDDLSDVDEVEWALRSLDVPFREPSVRDERVSEFFGRLAKLLPQHWRILGMALCPTGHLLVSALQVESDDRLRFDTVCIFPEAEDSNDSKPSGVAFDHGTYENLVSPIDELIEENNRHLQMPTENVSDDDQSRRQWWDVRLEMDQRLQNHLQRIESRWFDSKILYLALFGPQSQGNLFAKFESAFDCDDESGASDCQMAPDPTILLILDEDLHRIPFEGMPCFSGRAVTRPASLPFVLAKLQESSMSRKKDRFCINPRKTSCVLDPESNLGATKERIAPFLEKLNQDHGAEWNFVVGEAPTSEFIESQLAVKDGLMLYVGHGAGREYFSRRDIEAMVRYDAGRLVRGIKSSLILMGCSSGRLESVNRKHTKCVGAKLPILIEPEGIAQTYIAAGAPCVVANLWDVTDKDIDRFSMDLLSRFFDEPGASLPECVAQARAACKMKHIVGCAPVCYGLPVMRK